MIESGTTVVVDAGAMVDGYCADFTKANPDVTIKPIYAGKLIEQVDRLAS